MSLSFSSDSWSHVLAIFSNGSAKIYSMKSKSKEVASRCPYIPKDTISSALDMTEIHSLTGQHMMTNQDRFIKNPIDELGIIGGIFHPGFNLFGIQKSIMFGTKSNSYNPNRWNNC